MPLDRGSEEEMNTFQAEKSDWGSTKGGRISFEAAWRRRFGEIAASIEKKKVFTRTHQKSKFVEYAYPIIFFE